MRISFIVFNLILIFGLNAQQKLSVSHHEIDVFSNRYVYFPTEKVKFREYGDTWFTTVIDLINIGEIPPLSVNPWGQKALLVSVFPDSTIIAGIDPVTKESYRPFIHGMADIINPSRTPSQWADQWTDVLIDSLEIPFVYTRNTNDSIVDTMFVDYIISQPDNLLSYYDLNDNSKPDFGEFMHQTIYHTDISTNKLDDGQIFRTDTLLLTPTDSSFLDNFSINFKGIDVNDSVLGKERYGVYVRFQPGYEWDLNDTIDDFNKLLLLTREQKQNEIPRQIWPTAAGFCSYSMTRHVRYNSYFESYYLVPGIIPVSEWRLEHLIVSYKLTSNALAQNNVESSIQLKLFPNPVSDILNVRFSTNYSDNINICIFDIMGKEVFRDNIDLIDVGSNLYRYNTSFLKPGIYSVKIGDASSKFLIK